MDYKNKYLKYKNKYNILKIQLGGTGEEEIAKLTEDIDKKLKFIATMERINLTIPWKDIIELKQMREKLEKLEQSSTVVSSSGDLDLFHDLFNKLFSTINHEINLIDKQGNILINYELNEEIFELNKEIDSMMIDKNITESQDKFNNDLINNIKSILKKKNELDELNKTPSIDGSDYSRKIQLGSLTFDINDLIKKQYILLKKILNKE